MATSVHSLSRGERRDLERSDRKKGAKERAHIKDLSHKAAKHLSSARALAGIHAYTGDNLDALGSHLARVLYLTAHAAGKLEDGPGPEGLRIKAAALALGAVCSAQDILPSQREALIDGFNACTILLDTRLDFDSIILGACEFEEKAHAGETMTPQTIIELLRLPGPVGLARAPDHAA